MAIVRVLFKKYQHRYERVEVASTWGGERRRGTCLLFRPDQICPQVHRKECVCSRAYERDMLTLLWIGCGSETWA